MSYSCQQEHPYHACKLKLFYANGWPRPCRRISCDSDKCRAKYAAKEFAILMDSFKIRPPDYASVLGFMDDKSTNWAMTQGYLRKFTQKMSKYGKANDITIKHDIRIEFSCGDRIAI